MAVKSYRIHPNDVFMVTELTEKIGAKPNTLPREIRMGRLRATKRAGRYYVTGEWVLQWLREGEIRRRKPAEVPAASSN